MTGRRLLLAIALISCSAVWAPPPPSPCEIVARLTNRYPTPATIEHARQAGLTPATPDAPVYTRIIIDTQTRTEMRDRREVTVTLYTHAYYDPEGNLMTETDVEALLVRLQRRGIAPIPPGWNHVAIAVNARTHVQARGTDPAGRLQPRYHPNWTHIRAHHKYDRNVEFGRALTQIRRTALEDINQLGLTRPRVLATMVLLLDTTLIRVGNQNSVDFFDHYGLTTLRKKHVISFGDGVITLYFEGKKGVPHDFSAPLHDEIEPILHELMDLPGWRLFRWVDPNGHRFEISEREFNDYLNSASGDRRISARNFRTWWATVLALSHISESPIPATHAARTRLWVAARRHAALALNNTYTEAGRSYIDHLLWQVYQENPQYVLDCLRRRPGRIPHDLELLSDIERATLRFLEQERRAHEIE